MARPLPAGTGRLPVLIAIWTLRQGERVERGEHARLGIRVECQYPPLLHQRARHRLGERPLRQAEFERRALAFVAGLVSRGENHHHVGARPRMLGQILGPPDCCREGRLSAVITEGGQAVVAGDKVTKPWTRIALTVSLPCVTPRAGIE
jgi:hypothetical protein